MAEDSELWDIICDGPHVPMKKLEETGPMVPKGRKEYNDIDRKAIEKNYHAKKILMCGIGPDEYNRVSTCDTAKEIWEALQTLHEGTTQVKQSKIDMLTTEYELFRMKDDESIQDMHTKFTSIINELHSLGDVIPRNKLALASWGDSSSESERESDAKKSSMLAVETEATKYDSLFALMAQSDDDDDEEDEEDAVNFKDVQRNLKSYSSKKLRSLSNVLIDAYYSLINDKEILTIELGQTEQSRDDIVVCVVDLNETIANLEKEKEALNERITSVENDRDDLMVVVVDLKETIEGLNNEKHTLEEKIASTEEEMDDLLVICTDLEETIEGLNREHKNVSLGKGKEVTSETHIMLKKELIIVKTSLCSELERNQQLQAELEKVSDQVPPESKPIRSYHMKENAMFSTTGSAWEAQCKKNMSEGILLGYNPQNKASKSPTKGKQNGRRYSWGTQQDTFSCQEKNGDDKYDEPTLVFGKYLRHQIGRMMK
ncbi:spindle pole body protein pcp1-like [Nicotiana sylvestris]|uniref:spindle pole body protein pcp1-like n=1 Tax=Nicotiana sylvestris TaxID=4096 RepID=UPI00388C4163